MISDRKVCSGNKLIDILFANLVFSSFIGTFQSMILKYHTIIQNSDQSGHGIALVGCILKIEVYDVLRFRPVKVEFYSNIQSEVISQLLY